MVVWTLNDLEEARSAIKKLFYNCFENKINFEDDFFIQKGDKCRLEVMRNNLNIPNDIRYDIQALKYIDEHTEDILDFHNVKPPCVALIPTNNTNFSRLEFCEVSEKKEFIEELNGWNKNELTLDQIKKIFENNNVKISFFNSGVSLPITYDEFEIILKKSFKKRLVKNGSTIKVELENLNMKLTLN